MYLIKLWAIKEALQKKEFKFESMSHFRKIKNKK